MTKTIFEIEKERFEWSLKTFPDANAGHSLNHLKKEIEEIELSFCANTPDVMEFADAQFLLWDSAQRAGITLEQLFAACTEKFKILKTRNWELHKDGHYQHIEENDL